MVIDDFHQPVMVEEVCQWLVTRPQGVYVDATVGGGGHALALTSRLPEGYLVGIDRDREALERARKVLELFRDRVTLVHGNFSHIGEVLSALNISRVTGILFDLGVSSWQLNEGGRGFSFAKEGPLDMRMDTTQSLDAYWVVNHYSEKELADLIFRYGEEKYARRIARAIVRERVKAPIRSTRELAELISRIVPKGGRIHPATRTFMALRIFVNRELEELFLALSQVPLLLERGGRVGVMSYHSLEDRIVKKFFRESPLLNVLTQKPLRPSKEEVKSNFRSRSARFRVAERNETGWA